MSASPYGLGLGRNSGQRGRVGNKPQKPSQNWNAKQYSKRNDPLQWRKEAVLHQEYEKEKEKNKMECTQSRAVVLETNRLKRKKKTFEDMCDKEYAKRLKKQEAKEEAKKFHKTLLLLSKKQEEKNHQQQQYHQHQEESNEMNCQ